MSRSYVLTVEHVHPAHCAITRQITGSPDAVRKMAARILKALAERFGTSPLALSWGLEVVA